MKLLKKHLDILKLLVKEKGVYTTKLITRDNSIKEMETVIDLYMKDILSFEKVSELEIVGPKREPRFKALRIQSKLDVNKLKSIIKSGKYET